MNPNGVMESWSAGVLQLAGETMALPGMKSAARLTWIAASATLRHRE